MLFVAIRQTTSVLQVFKHQVAIIDELAHNLSTQDRSITPKAFGDTGSAAVGCEVATHWRGPVPARCYRLLRS